MPSRLTAAQVRGARGILNWSMLDFARAAGVSVATIKRVEEVNIHAVSSSIVSTIQEALEAAEVRFSEGEDGSFGIHFRPRPD